MCMDTNDYFEKDMQNFNLNPKGRSIRKYCQMESIDYKWLQKHKKTYPHGKHLIVSWVI